MARGGVAVSRGSGVSGGLETLFFFFGVGDFSAAVVFFFFFPFGDGSFTGDFFGFGLALASGVSLGVADASDASAGDFLFFALGEGGGDFFVLCGELFDFGVGVGDSSAEFTACALRMGVVFSSVCCA